MKVKELTKILKTLPQDANVYISRDEEGNGFGSIEEGKEYSSLSFDKEKNILVIFPWEERMEYDELK